MPQVMVLWISDESHLSQATTAVRMLQEANIGIMQGWLAIDGDAQMVLDIFATPELGGGLHTAVVKESDLGDLRYVIEHSLVCRRTGEMTSCPYIELMQQEWAEDAWQSGRYTLGISEVHEEHGIDRLLTVQIEGE